MSNDCVKDYQLEWVQEQIWELEEKIRQLQDENLKLRICEGVGASVDGICFGAFDTELGYALENHGGRLVHVAGRLDINTWQGRQSVQLRIEDAAFAGE